MASLSLWFLADQARFRHEREALVALANRTDWLNLGPCRFDAGCMVVNCDIDIGHQVYQAVLRFPETFPHSPPSIRPRDGQGRWSIHQFGDGGDLCLEYRPDNWSPELMAWQMVESAYRLLQGENPAPNEHARVASAHRTTEGQRLRTAFSRLPLTRALEERLCQLLPGAGVRGSSVFYLTEDNVVRFITGLDLPDEDPWVDPDVPSMLGSETWKARAYVRRLAAHETLPSTASYAEFSAGAEPLGWQATDQLLVVLKDDAIHAYQTFDDYLAPVSVIRAAPVASRLSDEHRLLADKRVAVLGCGSMGSKIATMLARAGVKKFDLVDDDILGADNLVRHDLDWREVGQHKVMALANRIRRVRPGADVRVRTQQLAGQESSRSAETILSRLAECDLILDATANPAAGNILSGFAQAAHIPLVWAEVFGGGVGGLMVRHRPGIEPPVPLMRRAIENWFADRGVAPEPQVENYQRTGDEAPMVADDADVTTIAANTARMAIDVLLGRDPSYFPWSVYVMGLSPCDLFAQPFETHPIALPEPPPAVAETALTMEEFGEEISFLQRVLAGPTELI